MGHVELDNAQPNSDGTNPFFFAVLATFVLATSAFVLRSKRPTADPPFRILDASLAQKPPVDTQPSSSVQDQVVKSTDSQGDGKETKGSRSKERRRRGKDPLRELLKSGRKTKTSRPGSHSTPDPGTASPQSATTTTIASQAIESSQDSCDGSVATSSRSSSPPMPLNSLDILPASPALSRRRSSPERANIHRHVDVDSSSRSCTATAVSSSDAPTNHDPRPSLPPSASAPPALFDLSHEDDQKVGLPPVAASESSLSTSTSLSALSFSNSASQPVSHTYEKLSDLPHINTSQSIPLYSTPLPSNIITLSPPNKSPMDSRRMNNNFVPKFNGPWDWDLNHTSPPNETTYQKPPRFRSKSRVSSSGSISPMPVSMSYNISYTPPTSASYSPISSPPLPTPSSSCSSISQPSDPSLPLTFPTLNSPSPSPSPLTHRFLNASVSGSTNGTASNVRRTPTPRRATTPSTAGGSNGGTPPPPSLSTQTQIASLRGALEAARMREEKARQEAEQYAKEYEMLRWRWCEDSTAWRRKEAELQAQVHHLMHQLQAYAAYALPSPTSSALQVPSISQQSYLSHHISPSSPQSKQPLRMQMLAQSTGNTSPLQTRSHSPFLTYPTQQTSAGQTQQQPNLFSLLFPGPPASASPVVAAVQGGSPPSVDSMSPPASLDGSWDRGMQQTRGGDGEEDWIISPGHEEGENGGLDGESAGSGMIRRELSDVSDVLADAILKRPETIRTTLSSTPSTNAPDSDSPKAEFTFPSISYSTNTGGGGGTNDNNEEWSNNGDEGTDETS